MSWTANIEYQKEKQKQIENNQTGHAVLKNWKQVRLNTAHLNNRSTTIVIVYKLQMLCINLTCFWFLYESVIYGGKNPKDLVVWGLFLLFAYMCCI